MSNHSFVRNSTFLPTVRPSHFGMFSEVSKPRLIDSIKASVWYPECFEYSLILFMISISYSSFIFVQYCFALSCQSVGNNRSPSFSVFPTSTHLGFKILTSSVPAYPNQYIVFSACLYFPYTSSK